MIHTMCAKKSFCPCLMLCAVRSMWVWAVDGSVVVFCNQIFLEDMRGIAQNGQARAHFGGGKHGGSFVHRIRWALIHHSNPGKCSEFV